MLMDDNKIEALISKKLIEPIMAQFKTIYEDIAKEYNIPLDELIAFLGERIGTPPVKKVNLTAIQNAKNNSKYLNLKTQKAIQQTVSNKKNFIFYDDLGVAVPKQNEAEYADIIKQLNSSESNKASKPEKSQQAGKRPKKEVETAEKSKKVGKRPKKEVETTPETLEETEEKPKQKVAEKSKKEIETEKKQKVDKKPKKEVETTPETEEKPKQKVAEKSKKEIETAEETEEKPKQQKDGEKSKKEIETAEETEEKPKQQKDGKKPKKEVDEIDEMIKMVSDVNEKRLDYEDGKWIDKEMKKVYVKKGQEIEEEEVEDVEYVFTDGSCFNNGKEGSIGGFGIFFGKGDPRNKSKKYKGTTTNNYMELLAIFECFKIFKKNRKYCIISDSEYAINCVTKWYKKWINNGWKNNSNEDVANRELIQSILDKKKEFNVSLMHTKSHQERPQDVNSFDYLLWYGNNAADKLAKNITGDIPRNMGQND